MGKEGLTGLEGEKEVDSMLKDIKRKGERGEKKNKYRNNVDRKSNSKNWRNEDNLVKKKMAMTKVWRDFYMPHFFFSHRGTTDPDIISPHKVIKLA